MEVENSDRIRQPHSNILSALSVDLKGRKERSQVESLLESCFVRIFAWFIPVEKVAQDTLGSKVEEIQHTT